MSRLRAVRAAAGARCRVERLGRQGAGHGGRRLRGGPLAPPGAPGGRSGRLPAGDRGPDRRRGTRDQIRRARQRPSPALSPLAAAVAHALLHPRADRRALCEQPGLGGDRAPGLRLSGNSRRGLRPVQIAADTCHMDSPRNVEEWADAMLERNRTAPPGTSLEDEPVIEYMRERSRRYGALSRRFAAIEAVLWLVGAVLLGLFVLAFYSSF